MIQQCAAVKGIHFLMLEKRQLFLADGATDVYFGVAILVSLRVLLLHKSDLF